MYHNIVKTEGFEPKNAKNAGDFDSTGKSLPVLNFSKLREAA